MSLSSIEKKGTEERYVTGRSKVELDCAPAAIRVEDGNIVPSRLMSATHVAIGCIDGEIGQGEVVVDYFGSAVLVLLVSMGGKTYLYYDAAQRCLFSYAAIYGMLTRHYTGDFGVVYGTFDTLDFLFKGLPTLDALRQEREDIWDWAESLPKTKISGDHQLHYTAVEVLTAIGDEKIGDVRAATVMASDCNTTAAAGWMLWLATIDSELRKQFLSLNWLQADSLEGLAKQCKTLTVRAKSLQNILPRDLRDVFEIEVLTNRSVGAVDWQAEHDNRVNVDTVRISPSEVYAAALEIFTRPDSTKSRPRKMTWESYYKDRWQWSAPGSIHSQYAVDKAELPDDHRLKTKFIALIKGHYEPMQYYINREPSIHAWASYKYEWAKMRAIYGTDLTSYVLTNFVFFNCEQTLPNEFPVGDKANDAYVRSKIASVLHGATPMCVDFSDFNSQHSSQSMQAVIQAYADAYRADFTDDQLIALKWVKHSISEMIVHDNMGLKKTYKANGTLMSGWRLTTFMNSVLNKIYTDKLLSSDVSSMRSVHNGDDVLVGLTKFSDALGILKMAMKYNVRLQPAKCAFGGIAEFLRIDHMRGATGQYLARNLATLVHSRPESQLSTNWVQALEANEVRLGEYVTRGGDLAIARNLREIYVRRRAAYYGVSEDDMYYVRTLHRSVGGLEKSKRANVTKVVEITAEAEGDLLEGALPGVADYAVSLAKSLGFTSRRDEIIPKIADRVRKATLKATSYAVYTARLAANTDVRKSQMYLGLYGAFSRVNKASKFGKAKSVGMVMDIVADDDVISLIKSNALMSGDPLEYISMVC